MAHGGKTTNSSGWNAVFSWIKYALTGKRDETKAVSQSSVSASSLVALNARLEALEKINASGKFGDMKAESLDAPSVMLGGVPVSPSDHTHQVKINGSTKTIAKTGDTPVDLGTYLTQHQDISGKADVSTVVDSASYDSSNHTIVFKHGSTQLFTLDAAAFVKDGMVDSVVISSGNLVITFNTDAGKQPISIPLTDIFNPNNYYDKTQTDTLLAGKQDNLPSAGTTPTDTYAINVSGSAKSVAPDEARYNTDKNWLKVGTFVNVLPNTMFKGVTFSVEYRANDGHSQSGLLWISAGEHKTSGDYGNDDIVAEYSTIGRRTNNLTDDVKFYVKSLGTSSTSGVEIYAYLYNYSELSITPLNVPEGSYTPEMTYVNEEPSGIKEVTYSMLLRSQYGTSKGSPTNPVYVDDKGNVQPCDNANMSVGGANNAGYATIASTAHALDTAQGASNVPVYFGSDGRPLKAFSIPSRLWVYTTINDDVNGYSLFHPCKLFDSGTVLDSDKYFQYRVKVRNGFIKIIFRWTSNVNTLYSENKVNGNVVWSRLTGSSSTNVDVESVAKSYTNVSSGSDMDIASFALSSNQSFQNIRSQGMVIIDAYQEGARILGTRLFLKFDFNFIKSAGQNTSVDAILDSELYVIGG